VVDEAKPPKGLGAAGRQLWREVARAVAVDDLELTVQERRWLLSACRLTDRLEWIEAAMDTEPAVTVGYNKQPVANPLLTEIRQFHALISLTLRRIRLDAPEDAGGVLGVVGVNKARGAANRRWRGTGA
jgi:hypothetical protein